MPIFIDCGAPPRNKPGNAKTRRFCARGGDERAQQFAFGAHDANFFRVDLDPLGECTQVVATVTAALGPHPLAGLRRRPPFTRLLNLCACNGPTGVTVIELIPPAVETQLYRDEALATEPNVPKGMDVEVFAKKAIARIEAGKLEVRPGLANAMMILSRVAPEITLKQVAKMIPSLASAR